MKGFQSHEFDPNCCRDELAELQSLLRHSAELGERRDILPFFRKRLHLSALLGSYNPRISSYDRVAYEYDVFGDFHCDLAIGDAVRAAYVFVEFEDAGQESVFVSRGRTTPEWSPRFDHGYSQIIDWLYKLSDMRPSDDFRGRFGSRDASFTTLLVVGRSGGLAEREQARLRWRQNHVVVDSKHVFCLTFDELCEDLHFRVKTYQSASLVAGRQAAQD